MAGPAASWSSSRCKARPSRLWNQNRGLVQPQSGLSAGRVCRPERPLPWGVMVPPGRACPWRCFHVEPSGQKAKMCGPRASAGACVSALTLQLAELDSQELAVSLVPSLSYTLNQGPAHARHPDKR